jgi:hypothetical protein
MKLALHGDRAACSGCSSTWRNGTMNRTLALITTLAAIGTATALAEARGPACRSDVPKYDPTTETTIAGTVEKVELVDCCCPRGGTGMHLVVQTGAESIEVHLGPSSFIAEHQMELAPDDALEIVGSRVVCGGERVLLARQVTAGDRTLTLRDAQGRPEWSGRGRR